MSIFVVAGATGHVGSVVARELLAKGAPGSRCRTQREEKGKELASLGAELLVGELSDVKFITGALRGADGAFLLQPPPAQDIADVRAFQDSVVHAEAGAVAESGIRHVVQLSSWGAEASAGTGPIVGLAPSGRSLEEDARDREHSPRRRLHGKHPAHAPGGAERGCLSPFPARGNEVEQHRDARHRVRGRSRASRTTRRDGGCLRGRRPRIQCGGSGRVPREEARQGHQVGPRAGVAGLRHDCSSRAPVQPLADAYQEMYEGMSRGLFGIESGHRVEKGTTTLEEAIDPYLAKKE